MAESGITDSSLIFLVFTALLMFWGLDGYFLWQERLYRKLYDNTRKEIGEETDYSMNTQDYMKEVDSWLKVCMSKTLLGFHGVMTAALGLYFLIRCLQK